MRDISILIVDDEEAIRKSYLSILEPKNQDQALVNLASELFEEDDCFLADCEDLLEDDCLLDATMDSDHLERPIAQQIYQLTETSQGQQAIEVIQQSLVLGKPYALIFLDMRMPPGINGLETAKQIRQLDAYVEIVIMTAYSDYTYDEIVQAVGSEERLLYFHKPFSTEQILQLATTLTQKWLLEKEARKQEEIQLQYRNTSL